MARTAMPKVSNKRRDALGLGAYESKIDAEDTPSTEHARNIFLDCIRDSPKARQRVLDSLAGEPFRLYQQTDLYFESSRKRDKQSIAARYLWTEYRRPAWQDIETPPPKNHRSLNHSAFWDCAPVDTDKNILAFRKCLIDLSCNCYLDEMWFRARCYGTLDLWCVSSEAYHQRIWQDDRAWFPIIDSAEFKFERFKRQTNYPQYGFREDVKVLMIESFKREGSPDSRTLKACEKELKTFLTNLEQEAKKNGLVAMRRKRQSKKRLHAFEQFEWLVEHQINGKPYEQIAGEYCERYEAAHPNADDGIVTDKARICEGVHDAAARVKLTKLRPTQGRPRFS